MLPGTLDERRQLAIDLLDYCNLLPKLWEGRHPWVIGKILHKITDPRETEPLVINRGTRVLAAVKKNASLWTQLKPFVTLPSWGRVCKCKHHRSSHDQTVGSCSSPRIFWDTHSAICKCTHYVEREL